MKFHRIDIRGKFWLPQVDDHSTEPHYGKVDEGRMFYSKSTDAVYFGDQDEWVLITRRQDVLVDGTKVLMGKYPLPNYWNIDFTANDLVPLISNDELQAGSLGGSWSITGLETAGAHDHGGVTGSANNSIVIGSSDIYTSVARDTHTHTLQVDGLHSHTFDGSWRPAYTKFMVVRYDVE
jgi:hypothetical protein